MSGAALLLPGQGAQYVGMGRDLAEAFPAVEELYERADDALGIRLSRLSWEGPDEELTATENAQPAILLHSYATWCVIRDEIEVVGVGAGHSLGEFSAHLIAGTFDLEAALRVVRRRGELMAASGNERPGTMAAVLGLEEDVVSHLCSAVSDGVVVAANLNAPGQIVISGDVPAVQAASALAEEAGARRVVPLNVSGAFHSPLMEVAVKGLGEALAATEMDDPGFPIVANATARPVTDAETARRTLLSQLTSPVRWVDSMESMRATGPDVWIELGPGGVLAGLLRRFDRGLRASSLGDPESIDAFIGGGR
ncbi:MAG: ACP S-malonyltransferase [Gemmatimonadota bacterium]|nr:ACP S-malonyltransferase [Gemmatimonadota bacterium]